MNEYQRYIRANCQELLCGQSTAEIWDGQLSGRHTHILKCRSLFKWQEENVWCKWEKQPDKKWYVFWHSNGSFCDRGWPARQWHLWTPQLHPPSLQCLHRPLSGALFPASSLRISPVWNGLWVYWNMIMSTNFCRIVHLCSPLAFRNTVLLADALNRLRMLVLRA